MSKGYPVWVVQQALRDYSLEFRREIRTGYVYLRIISREIIVGTMAADEIGERKKRVGPRTESRQTSSIHLAASNCISLLIVKSSGLFSSFILLDFSVASTTAGTPDMGVRLLDTQPLLGITFLPFFLYINVLLFAVHFQSSFAGSSSISYSLRLAVSPDTVLGPLRV